MDINKEDDMDVLDFARKICMCSIDTPISLEFDRLYGQKKDVWWSCQREHLTGWCLYQPTTGLASYKHKPNRSARKMYNYFNRPETLLWLAEALGEKEEILYSIIDAIKNVNNGKEACGILRKYISFDRILELLNGN